MILTGDELNHIIISIDKSDTIRRTILDTIGRIIHYNKLVGRRARARKGFGVIDLLIVSVVELYFIVVEIHGLVTCDFNELALISADIVVMELNDPSRRRWLRRR